jgi:hypothetical protein
MKKHSFWKKNRIHPEQTSVHTDTHFVRSVATEISSILLQILQILTGNI